MWAPPNAELLLAVISVLPAALLVAYLGIALQRAVWRRWDANSLEWARAAMLTVATGKPLSTTDKRRLAVLSPPVQARLFRPACSTNFPLSSPALS